jgi:hypothetical protein
MLLFIVRMPHWPHLIMTKNENVPTVSLRLKYKRVNSVHCASNLLAHLGKGMEN